MVRNGCVQSTNKERADGRTAERVSEERNPAEQRIAWLASNGNKAGKRNVLVLDGRGRERKGIRGIFLYRHRC